MSVWIATGITHSYLARAEAYLASLRRHEPARSHVFTVNFHPGQDIGLRHSFVDYEKCLKADKFMLQMGAWTVACPPEWRLDDVVAFTDADCSIQRPLSGEEIAYFEHGTLHGGVLIGRNKPDPTQTLAEESFDLFPQANPQEIARRFPGLDRMLAKNTGFLVATVATWRRLYADVQKIWPLVARMWTNPARVQMAICIVVQSNAGYRLGDLDLSIHAHAHLGMPPEVAIGEDGVARHRDRVIFMRHVL